MESPADNYDVVIIGGALSGSSLALLLRRWRKTTRILVLEQAPEFDRKVGEATVELSGFFLSHVLRLHDVLSRDHLHKMGLRFWFGDGDRDRDKDGARRPLSEMSEVSAQLLPSLPSFQLDRAKLDETLLELAREAGVHVERPAKVTQVQLDGFENRVQFESTTGTHNIRARWVIDASGKRCLLGKQLGLIERFDEHQTAAAWGRWCGVRDLDGADLLGGDVRKPAPLLTVPASRRLCTNHFCGHGWWIWMIPLANGDTSLGIVHDRKLFALPGEGSKRERYESFLRSCDGLGELLEGAELDADDFRSYEHLAYRARQFMGEGWALVGDASAFLDPYYSPGLDHCAISVYATASILEKDLNGESSGEALQDAIGAHNERFERSYPLYFDALYRDKYELFGDAELTAIAFYLDTAMYYLGIVHEPLRNISELGEPPFGRNLRPVVWAARWMAFTNRRLVHIARARQKRGTYGRRNLGWTCMTDNFGSSRRKLTAAHWKGLCMWARVELGELRERAFGATSQQ